MINVSLKVELEEDEPEENAIKEIQGIIKDSIEGGFTVYEDLKIVGQIVGGQQ
jgi:hypothetical protein